MRGSEINPFKSERFFFTFNHFVARWHKNKLRDFTFIIIPKKKFFNPWPFISSMKICRVECKSCDNP